MAEVKKKGKKAGKQLSPGRKRSLQLAAALLALLALWSWAGVWFVHHPRAWHAEKTSAWPRFATSPLFWIGNPVGDLTDALGLTGEDAVYEYDTEAPNGQVLFAGAPRRTGFPAPSDIRVLDRGEFLVGWSDTLRHPVWCAYHVKRGADYSNEKRPSFLIDKSVPGAPRPDAYLKSGYDRGHLVPNYAILTRYGEEARRKTFLMSNIAPQSPALNRGVWRDVEHRIAELWTARYGEIWVIVGCFTPRDNHARFLPQTSIDIPLFYYQVVVAQEGLDVRAFAVIFPQHIPWSAWPTRYLVSIDELEEMCGLDFNPELPDFIQSPLEAELPTRLWPIRARDIFRQIAIRFAK